MSYFSGDLSTTMELFPFQKYAEADYAAKYGDPAGDQVWVVCVDAYKEIPLEEWATPYLIERDICSNPFIIPPW